MIFRLFKIKVTNSLSELFNDPEVNFILVCSANKDHFKHAQQVLSAGKHLLIEKPITLTLAEADELRKIAKINNLTIGGILQYEFLKAFQEAKRVIANKTLGQIIHLNCNLSFHRSNQHYARGRGSLEKDGGGVLISQGIHVLGMIESLIGPIKKTYAVKGNCSHQLSGEDTFSGLLLCEKATATLFITTAAATTKPITFELTGTKGEISFNSKNEIKINNRKKLFLFQDIYYDQVENFVNSLLIPSQLIVDFDEARRALANTLQLYESCSPNE